MMDIEKIRRTVNKKVIAFNLACERGQYEYMRECFQRLQGMQEVLQDIGVRMYMKTDADFHLVCDIEA